MRAERLGSYSMETTVAGTPFLSRLKSIARSLRLCPPPRCQMVMSPRLRRPPVRSLILVSALCGLSVVSSSLVNVVLNRNDGVIGLYVLIAINQPLVLALQISRVLRHLFAGFQLHIRFLPVRTIARETSAAP